MRLSNKGDIKIDNSGSTLSKCSMIISNVTEHKLVVFRVYQKRTNVFVSEHLVFLIWKSCILDFDFVLLCVLFGTKLPLYPYCIWRMNKYSPFFWMSYTNCSDTLPPLHDWTWHVATFPQLPSFSGMVPVCQPSLFVSRLLWHFLDWLWAHRESCVCRRHGLLMFLEASISLEPPPT